MRPNQSSIVVIAGPTASGKTAVGLKLAEQFSGEIVSADSVQVYRYLDVGSAKPSPEERSRVPHHMIDVRDPDEEFSAGDYVREARASVEGIVARGLVPFLVGGTGLYIRLLLGGVIDVPPSSPELRQSLLRQKQVMGPGYLYRRLCSVDPETASKTAAENVARIIRALEVFELTGKPVSLFQRGHAFRDSPYRRLFICLAPDRKVLYERIDKRVDSMVKGGLFDEVRDLYERGYGRQLKSLQSLGYRHVGMVLAGEMDRDDAIGVLKRDTRRYAKRQFTWFRSEPGVLWINPDDEARIRFEVANFLGR